MLGSQLHQYPSGFDRSLSQKYPEMTDRKRAKGPGIPWAQIGIAHHNLHRIQIYIQLFGQQLGKRGYYALAHFDLSGIEDNPVIGPDSQKGIKISGNSGTEKTATRPAGEGAAVKSVEANNDPAA
jgi:hypothetical protein